ncbi:MAG: hypothetical protein AAB933_03300 [Patescibacteria group bacterium]
MLSASEFKKLNVEEVEERVEKIIEKLKIGDRVSLAWLKDFTYNFDLPTKEINKAYFGKIFNLLPCDISEKDMNEAVSVFNDVWNCFPQKIIGGISPQDKFFEDDLKAEKEADDKLNGKIPLTEEEQLWKDHFDRARGELDPYLDWTQKEVMPKYNKYVKAQEHKKPNEVVGVAGVLLEICGQMGFLEFQKVHHGFIKDFPDMFLASVVGPNLSRNEVKEYLDNFLIFLENYYPVNSFKRII